MASIWCLFAQNFCSWEEVSEEDFIRYDLILSCSEDLDIESKWEISTKEAVLTVICADSNVNMNDQIINHVPPLNKSALDAQISLNFLSCFALSFSFSVLSEKFPEIKQLRIEGASQKIFLSESLFDKPTSIRSLELNSMIIHLSPKHFENLTDLEELHLMNLDLPSDKTIKKTFFNWALKRFRTMLCKQSLSIDWLGKKPNIKMIKIVASCVNNVPLGIFQNFQKIEEISLQISNIFNLNV